ncbi:MAG: exodeoxyribonuclease VII large subunit [Neisseriales bacterium]|nr:MAG: exodeoxyribonuclease VII large subunit [Neisseriales bacterium]
MKLSSLIDPTASLKLPKTVIRVSELNSLARAILEGYMPHQWIGGEISNWALSSSGHAYFSLKDDKAQVRCVIFRYQLAKLAFTPSNGGQVELYGQVSLYEPRGEFQITVEVIREAGLGKLYEAFNQLKNKLFQEGLFDVGKKRPLPSYPRAIGVITSMHASVLRDVVSTIQKQAAGLPIILYPTSVQGIDAPLQIIQAIQMANQRKEVDVLIICRGGGSIEDLAAFNDEAVVRTITTSSIPTISGVGHETDITLCDFAADYRAATPTAAATAASSDYITLQKQLDHARSNLQRTLIWQINNKAQRLDHMASRLISPWRKWVNQRDRLMGIYTQLTQVVFQHLRNCQTRLTHTTLYLRQQIPDLAPANNRIEQIQMKLQHAMRQKLNYLTEKVNRCHLQLSGLNPDLILQKGYVAVSKLDGTPVYAPDELTHGDRVTLRFKLGTTRAIIDKS